MLSAQDARGPQGRPAPKESSGRIPRPILSNRRGNRRSFQDLMLSQILLIIPLFLLSRHGGGEEKGVRSETFSAAPLPPVPLF